MRTIGKGDVGPLWHSTTVEKWVMTKAPYSDKDRQIMAVDNQEDALIIARLLRKSNTSVFVTHVVEEHFHLRE